MANAPRIFVFGDFELDEALRELRRTGQPRALAPRSFRLLLYLLEQRSRLVTKEELLAAVWPGVAVSDAALSGALRDVRDALDDDGAEQRWIQTRRKCGYRFVAAVELRPAPWEASVSAGTGAPAPLLQLGL